MKRFYRLITYTYDGTEYQVDKAVDVNVLAVESFTNDDVNVEGYVKVRTLSGEQYVITKQQELEIRNLV